MGLGTMDAPSATSTRYSEEARCRCSAMVGRRWSKKGCLAIEKNICFAEDGEVHALKKVDEVADGAEDSGAKSKSKLAKRSEIPRRLSVVQVCKPR